MARGPRHINGDDGGDDDGDDGGDYGGEHGGDSVDEDPLDEDLDRFDEGESYCPHCGAEVWDDVSVCPQCRSAISMPSTRPPLERWWRERWRVVVVIAVLLALGGLGFRLLF